MIVPRWTLATYSYRAPVIPALQVDVGASVQKPLNQLVIGIAAVFQNGRRKSAKTTMVKRADQYGKNRSSVSPRGVLSTYQPWCPPTWLTLAPLSSKSSTVSTRPCSTACASGVPIVKQATSACQQNSCAILGQDTTNDGLWCGDTRTDRNKSRRGNSHRRRARSARSIGLPEGARWRPKERPQAPGRRHRYPSSAARS